VIDELELIDSTSLEVRRRLEQGISPVAVMAHSQSQGRGQKDRKWDSHPGNLHLSFSVPYSDPRLAMITATRIKKIIFDTTGIACHIKWPNDLYIGGKKLCGILIETLSENLSIVGVGLNLKKTPLETACSISDFGIDLDAKDLAMKIIHALREQPLRSAEIMDEQQLGMPWRMQDGTWLRYHGLKVEPVCLEFSKDTGETVQLVSAQDLEAPLWKIHTKDHPMILADIGNTRTKLYPYGDIASLPQLKEQHWPIFVSSVNDKKSIALQEELYPRFRLLTIAKHNVYLRKSLYDFSQIGSDRFFLIQAAARRQLDPSSACYGKAVLVVSCGTALTVDFVDAKRIHQGGYILPGLQSSLSALSRATQLPDVVLNSALESSWPTHTQLAMSRGIRCSIVCWLKALQSECNAEILCTGGDAHLIVDNLDVVHDGDLVFEGMKQVLNLEVVGL
jgi:biotin-[acetyl-CoA-carboxylase] ligase BirA-like protein